MSCPDDETIAGFMDGQLAASVARRIELHVDQCESCTQLLAELGRAYGPSASRAASLTAALREDEPPRHARPPRSDRALLALVHWTLWSIHAVTLGAVATLLALLPPGDDSIFVAVAQRVTSLGAVYLAYLVVWSAIGLVCAPVCARGVSRNADWARRAVQWFAYASLPSVVGTGHGLYALRLLGEGR